MTKRKTPKKDNQTPVAFLLKKGDKFYMIPDVIISELSIDEAFRLGMTAHIELRKQLLEDALRGDHYIENVKVVDGLEASLKKLEDMFPNMREQIRIFDKGYHFRVGRG